MKKKHQVVMLPTNIEAPNYTQGHIVKCIKSWTPIGENPKETNKLSISKNWSEDILKHYEAQHLFILSDEEIKAGDWMLHPNKGFKVGDIWNSYINPIKAESHWFSIVPSNKAKVHGFKKIIATTNSELWIENENMYPESLPQMLKSFIEYYISEYNKGNIITDVDVEYLRGVSIINEIQWGNNQLKLKVNPDNTISIYPIKNSWNREEVIEFGLKCVILGMDLKNNPLPRLNEISGKEYYYKWTEENL